MIEHVLGGLVITTGVLSTCVGFVIATHRLRTAQRVYRKTEALSAATPEGWQAWFLSGFSGMTMATRWLFAMVAWLAWTAAGVGLVGLGIRAF